MGHDAYAGMVQRDFLRKNFTLNRLFSRRHLSDEVYLYQVELLVLATPCKNSGARITTLLKSPEREERKTAEPKLSNVQAATTTPRSGRQIYIAKCSACHSSDGSGAGTIGKSMRIPSLTSPQVQGQSDEILASVISNGVGKMPAYGKKYSPEQIQLLVAYIRELARK